MSKKLLSEAQVRRFMGLAGIKPVNEMAYKHDDDKEMREGEELEEMRAKKDDEMREMRAKKDDEKLMEEEDDMAMDMDKGDDPMDMEGGDADVEMDEEDLADVKAALDTLQDKLAPLLDQAEEGDMDMEDEPEMDAEPPADDMDMPKDEEGEEDLDKELQEIDMQLSEEEIVNEVARRVAKRIVEAKRAHKKMNEALGRKK